MPLSFKNEKAITETKSGINPVEFNLEQSVVNLDSKYKNITTFALSLTVLYGLIFTGIQ
jgi:hypothetical protein